MIGMSSRYPSANELREMGGYLLAAGGYLLAGGGYLLSSRLFACRFLQP